MTKSRMEEVYDALRSKQEEDAACEKIGSVARLMAVTGAADSNVRKALKKLKEDDRAHICGWPGGAASSPIWCRGPGEDAPVPPKKPVDQLRKDAIARLRKKRRLAKEEGLADGRITRDGVALRETHKFIERVRSNGPLSWFAALSGF
jgi:hypothetical protein